MNTSHSQGTSLPRLAIVIPCYNEEAALDEAFTQLKAKLEECTEKKLISADSYLFFIDDGSIDATWSMLLEQHQKSPDTVKIARLAANRGKEFSLWAGFMEVREHCDIATTMDADLQYDIHTINTFIEKYHKGYEVIYGIKENRGKQSKLRFYASHCFYWLMKKLGTPVEPNQADYSLMTSAALNAMSEYGENQLLFRGIMKTIGFKQISVPFKVLDRTQGESKYSFISLINLSMDAITSFSVQPLRLIGGIGLLLFLISILMIIWIFIDFFIGNTITGWATLSVSIWLIGGLSMMSMAILGEYIGKIYMETKRRPRYHIKDRLF